MKSDTFCQFPTFDFLIHDNSLSSVNKKIEIKKSIDLFLTKKTIFLLFSVMNIAKYQNLVIFSAKFLVFFFIIHQTISH